MSFTQPAEPTGAGSSELVVLGSRPEDRTQDIHHISTTLRDMVLSAVTSEHSTRNYAKALDEVFALCAEKGEGISRPLLLEYRARMVEKGLGPSTINVRLAAVRKLISEAKKNGILGAEQATQMEICRMRASRSAVGELAHP